MCRVQLKAALDEHLLHEGIAHLNAGQFLATRPGPLITAEGVRRQHRHSADTVQSGARTEQDDLVSGTRGECQVQVLGAKHAHAHRVDQRITGIGHVEHSLAADIGQAQRVSITTDPAHHAVQHAAGVGCVGSAEAQLIHHRHRPRAHRHDVANDAADPGGRTLIGLDVRGVVVGLHLEGHRPTVSDIDDAGVLADTRQHSSPHRLGGGLTEIPQMHFGGLV